MLEINIVCPVTACNRYCFVFKSQASKLSSQIQNGAKNIFNKFNTQENRSWLQQLWDNVVNFFSHIFG